MKTVVTGGTGFIGSHLVKALVDSGREVIVVSNDMNLENLTWLGLKVSEIELRWANLANAEHAMNAVADGQTVFHLAARVGGLTYLHGTGATELETMWGNFTIDSNVFRACLNAGVSRLVYASSCAVYPMAPQRSIGAVFSETDCAIPLTSADPDGGYGWAKLLGEVSLGWIDSIEIGVARIFNVYGENEPLGARAHVIADLICKALSSARGPHFIRGTGQQTRDFLYVSDCVDALMRLALKAAIPPTVVNIGSGKASSIGYIAETIAKISGRECELVFQPQGAMGPVSRTADISRAAACLGWQPKVGLEEGLRRTYSWVERRLGAEARGLPEFR